MLGYNIREHSKCRFLHDTDDREIRVMPIKSTLYKMIDKHDFGQLSSCIYDDTIKNIPDEYNIHPWELACIESEYYFSGNKDINYHTGLLVNLLGNKKPNMIEVLYKQLALNLANDAIDNIPAYYTTELLVPIFDKTRKRIYNNISTISGFKVLTKFNNSNIKAIPSNFNFRDCTNTNNALYSTYPQPTESILNGEFYNLMNYFTLDDGTLVEDELPFEITFHRDVIKELGLGTGVFDKVKETFIKQGDIPYNEQLESFTQIFMIVPTTYQIMYNLDLRGILTYNNLVGTGRFESMFMDWYSDDDKFIDTMIDNRIYGLLQEPMIEEQLFITPNITDDIWKEKSVAFRMLNNMNNGNSTKTNKPIEALKF